MELLKALPWMRGAPHTWPQDKLKEMVPHAAYDFDNFVVTFHPAEPAITRTADVDQMTIHYGGNLEVTSKAALKAWGAI